MDKTFLINDMCREIYKIVNKYMNTILSVNNFTNMPSNCVVLCANDEAIYINDAAVIKSGNIEYEVTHALLVQYASDVTSSKTTKLNAAKLCLLCEQLKICGDEDAVRRAIFRIRKKLLKLCTTNVIERDPKGYFISPKVILKKAPK